MARTTRDTENMGKTVETMTRTAQEFTRIMTDYVVRAQEFNTRFASALSRSGSTLPAGRPS